MALKEKRIAATIRGTLKVKFETEIDKEGLKDAELIKLSLVKYFDAKNNPTARSGIFTPIK